MLTLSVKSKAGLIMNTKLARKYLYTEWRCTLQSRIQMAERTLDNYNNPYKWNNHDSSRKQTRKIEYPESQTIWRIDLDKELSS